MKEDDESSRIPSEEELLRYIQEAIARLCGLPPEMLDPEADTEAVNNLMVSRGMRGWDDGGWDDLAFVLALEEGGLAVGSESLQLPSFLGAKLFFKRWGKPASVGQWIVDASRQLRAKVRKKPPSAS